MIQLNSFDRLSLTQYVQENKTKTIDDVIIGKEIDPLKLNKLKRMQERNEQFYSIENNPIENIHPYINCLFQTLPIDFEFKQLFHEMIENIYYSIHSELILLDYQFEYIIRFHLSQFYQLIKTHHILLKYPQWNGNQVILDITGSEYDVNEFKNAINYVLNNLFETHFHINEELDKAIILNEKLSTKKVLVYWSEKDEIVIANSEQLIKDAQEIIKEEVMKTKYQSRGGIPISPRKDKKLTPRYTRQNTIQIKTHSPPLSQQSSSFGHSTTAPIQLGSSVPSGISFTEENDSPSLQSNGSDDETSLQRQSIEIPSQQIIFINRNAAEDLYENRILIETKHSIQIGYFNIEMNCIFDSIIERPEKPQRPIPQYWRQSKYSPSLSPRKSISPKLSQPKSIDKNLRKIPIAELNLESQPQQQIFVDGKYYHFNVEYKPQRFAGHFITRKEIVIYHQMNIWNSLRIDEIYRNKGGLDGNEINLKETLMTFDEGIRVIEYNTKTIDWKVLLDTLFSTASKNGNIGRITICVHNENDINSLLPHLSNYTFYWYHLFSNQTQGSTIDKSKNVIDITNVSLFHNEIGSHSSNTKPNIPENYSISSDNYIHIGDEFMLLNQFVREDVNELTVGNGYIHQYITIPIVLFGKKENIRECIETIEIMNDSQLDHNYQQLIDNSSYSLFPKYQEWISQIIKSFHVSYIDVIGRHYFSKQNEEALNTLLDLSIDFINAFEFLKERKTLGLIPLQNIINEFTRLSYEERRFALYKAAKPQYQLYNCLVLRGTDIVFNKETISGFDCNNLMRSDGKMEYECKKTINGIVFKIIEDENEMIFDIDDEVLLLTPTSNIIWRGAGLFTTANSCRCFLMKYFTSL